MSKEEKVVQEKPNVKVMDKYDIKQKKRKEAEEKAKKAKRRSIIIGIAAAVVIVAVVLSFPIRNWINLNGTYVTIGGEKVTKVEFAYYYNTARQKFVAENQSALSMYGISDTSTLESYMYTEDLSFAQYFSQQAMAELLTVKSLSLEARKEGFTYDTSAEVAEIKATWEENAASVGVSMDEYVASGFGALATWERIEPYITEGFVVDAYKDKIIEDNAPTEEEIQKEYEANSNLYACVDYRMTVVDADLPATDESGNAKKYTDEEVKAAMSKALEGAKEAVKTVATDGEEHKGERYAEVPEVVAEYLFFANRKAGDAVVLKDADNNRYLAVAFEDRYPDETVKPHLYIIASKETSSKTIMDEWKKGAANQDAFAELYAKYDESGNEMFLYTALDVNYFAGNAIGDWLAEEKEVGEVFGADLETGYNYVVYYAGQSEPAWKTAAEEAVLTNKVDAYMSRITTSISIEYK